MPTFVWVLAIVLDIVFAIAMGFRANERNRNSVGWFLISLLITPLISAALLFLLPARPEQQQRESKPGQRGLAIGLALITTAMMIFFYVAHL
jgi:NADH:ubiquinone oxidoreductase subunit 6 (subunit J)